MNSALVLSGGGALGIAHIGIVEGLAEAGYKFDFFCGVSAGAIVAALLAFGWQPDELLAMIEKRKVLRALLELAPRFPGTLIPGRKVEAMLAEVFGERRIEEAKFPLFIGVTDYNSGERITLNRGKVTDALRASISVPVLFEPYFNAELQKWLVDGGLTQNLPVDVAVEKYSGSKIIAVDVATSIKPFEVKPTRSYFLRPRALMDTFIRSFRIVLKNQQRDWPSDPRISLIAPPLADFNAINIFQLKRLYRAGREAASVYLRGVEKGD